MARTVARPCSSRETTSGGTGGGGPSITGPFRRNGKTGTLPRTQRGPCGKYTSRAHQGNDRQEYAASKPHQLPQRLRLHGEVHLLQEGLEAGVGAEGIEHRVTPEHHKQRIPFSIGPV